MPSEDRPPFHLAFPCTDIAAAVAFYEGLGATVGRHNDHAAIFGFFGHQIVAHRVGEIEAQHGIYPRHFGVMVGLDELDRIEADLRRLAPERTKRDLRFPGEPIEHHSLQSRDPSGNVLEFKTYTDPEAPFAPAADVRIGDVAV
jgi:extradiol dioxygenase family protein